VAVVATLNPTNVVNGVTEGRTLAVSMQQGVLANDQDPYGLPLNVIAVAAGRIIVAATTRHA
jgi:DhnA family fructose-bisphosphate aldolase class Ia